MSDIPPDVHARLTALETQVAFLFQQLNFAPPGAGPASGPGGLPVDIIELARSGNKIAAIKRHRELFGSSLNDAKDAIDQIA